MRTWASIATAGLVLGGCFFDPQGSVDAGSGSGAVDTGGATDGTGPTPTTSDPTADPTAGPTSDPTAGPTSDPTSDPTADPTSDPTSDTDTGATGFCGDAKIDPGEECDYGAMNNGMNGSLCKAGCVSNVCGDGYVAASEACDDGNNVDDDGCTNTCTVKSCGNGVLDPGEACDAGDANGGDECSLLCTLPFCGDGQVTGAEQCDAGAGNDDAGACTLGCMNAFCGDKLVHAGEEQCDDGNAVAGDGCTACTIDTCGNGKIDGMEACDDGNLENGDTCSDVCARTAYMVFVTSSKYKGDLGGLDGADAKCNALALGKLPGKYKAWLSHGATAASQRLFHSDKPYIRPDKAKIANDWADLTGAGDLIATINRTEANQSVIGAGCGGEAQVWTNTRADGSIKDVVDNFCLNWTYGGNGVKGESGVATSKSSNWTEACSSVCEGSARLYCFEQP